MKKYKCKHVGCYKMIPNPGYCHCHDIITKEKPEYTKSVRKPFTNSERPNEKLYQKKEWRALGKELITDSSVCFFCGCPHSKENKLQKHHIQRPMGNADLFFDKQNIILVCKNCHNSITGRESHIK